MVTDGYNTYVKAIGGAIGVGACANVKRGNKLYTIEDDYPLLYFLSDTNEEEGGNDWLFLVIADIVRLATIPTYDCILAFSYVLHDKK